MPLSKRESDVVRALCAQIYPDDGIDPRNDNWCEVDGTNKRDRKLQQLCKQVATALQFVLPSVQGLADVRVMQVMPAPNAGRMCVAVSVPGSGGAEQIAAQFERCSPYLRREVAQFVSRRRVPELVFMLVAEGAKDD